MGRVKSASFWVLTQAASLLVLRLISSLALTRLLFPEAFGVMALVTSIMVGLSLCSDAGLHAAIIRDPEGETKKYLDSAWSIQVIRGWFLYVLIIALAYPVAKIYDQPEIIYIFPVVGLCFVIDGYTSFAVPLLVRKMHAKPVALAEILINALTIAATVFFAWIQPSVWAIVLGTVLRAVFKFLLSYSYLSKVRHEFLRDPECTRRIVQFSFWILLSSIAFFIASQADKFFVGYVEGFAFLGIFSIAVGLAEPLRDVSWHLAYSVFYPRLLQGLQAEESLKKIYYKYKIFLDLIFLGGAGLLFNFAQPIINLLYDHRYTNAGWILELMSIRLALQCAFRPGEMALVAKGLPKYSFYQNLSRLLGVVILGPLGYYLDGVRGMIIGFVYGEIFPLLCVWYGLQRIGVFSLPREIVGQSFFAVGCLVSYSVVHFLK